MSVKLITRLEPERLAERTSQHLRRMEATQVQLHRMGFQVGAGWNGYESLTENGQEIYDELERRYGFATHMEESNV